MLTQVLTTLYNRDLDRLQKEIELYTNENTIWHTEKGIANSAGNLCLHLIGNLNTYIGKELGGTGYVRNRELEFSQKNIPRNELIKMIADTKQMVTATINSLSNQQLLDEYPVLVYETKMPTGAFLTYLTTHLTYHLGQINYHRRLLDEC
jgi:uncharacterized damage-inducible protein DinB